MAKSQSLRYTILKRSFPAQPGRRFLCFIIDLLFHLALTAALFLPTFTLIMNTPLYQNEENIVKNEVQYYIDYSKESKIAEYDENNNRYSADKRVYIYLARAICLSYNVFGTEGEPDFVLNEQVQKYGVLSKENDNICYFYTNYLAQEAHKDFVDMKGKDNITYYYDEFYNAFASPSDYFDMGNEKKAMYGLPVMKNNVANRLMKGSFTSDGTLGATLYTEIAEGLNIMFNRAEAILLNAEPYHTDHYIPYCRAISNCATIINVYLIVCILLAALVIFLVPKLIFGNETTFARRLFGLGGVRGNKQPVPWWMMLMRTLLEMLLSIGIMIIMYIFPPFNVDLSTLSSPIVYPNPLSFGIVVIAILVLFLLEKVPILFSHEKQSAIDIMFDVVIVDTHFQDDDYDEEMEAKPY